MVQHKKLSHWKLKVAKRRNTEQEIMSSSASCEKKDHELMVRSGDCKDWIQYIFSNYVRRWYQQGSGQE